MGTLSLATSVILNLIQDPSNNNNASMKQGYVYILASTPHGTLYIGVTSNLEQRLYQHQHGLVEGFTKQYDIKHLVYYETYDRIDDAILREKKLKNWHRDWKIALINKENPAWRDLALDWMDPESSSG